MYLNQSPFPKQEGLMPTFRTAHDDDMKNTLVTSTRETLGQGLGLGYSDRNNASNIRQRKKQRL